MKAFGLYIFAHFTRVRAGASKHCHALHVNTDASNSFQTLFLCILRTASNADLDSQVQEAAGTSEATPQAAGGTASAYPNAPRPVVQKSQVQNAPPQSSAHEATTVRNLVNLKKHTLRLAPREGSPNILDISFNLDVVSPCRCAPCALALLACCHVCWLRCAVGI